MYTCTCIYKLDLTATSTHHIADSGVKQILKEENQWLQWSTELFPYSWQL